MSMSNDQTEQLYTIAGHVFASIRCRLQSIGRDDAIQSAMLYCVKNADNWDPDKSSFATYFSMVCRHSMINANKSEMRGLKLLSGPSLSYTREDGDRHKDPVDSSLEHWPDNGVDTRDEFAEILKVIPGLSGHQRRTVSDFMKMESVPHLALRYKCSRSAISASRALAFKNIRKALFSRYSHCPN